MMIEIPGIQYGGADPPPEFCLIIYDVHWTIASLDQERIDIQGRRFWWGLFGFIVFEVSELA